MRMLSGALQERDRAGTEWVLFKKKTHTEKNSFHSIIRMEKQTIIMLEAWSCKVEDWRGRSSTSRVEQRRWGEVNFFPRCDPAGPKLSLRRSARRTSKMAGKNVDLAQPQADGWRTHGGPGAKRRTGKERSGPSALLALGSPSLSATLSSRKKVTKLGKSNHATCHST